MTVAIVGGGWFGCHLATVLDSRGVSVELFEQADRLFSGASGANQNRLHLGFHYPRSHITRVQSQCGFKCFTDAYPELSAPVEKNIYAICEQESLMDFETYTQVMWTAGLNFSFCDPPDYGLTNVEGAIVCDERVILTDKAREWFTNRLRKVVRLGERFENQLGYEWVINCTYQGWRPEFSRLVYQPCVTLIYRSKNRNAITLMDGKFFSVYPYKDDLVTLYSVQWSPIAGTSDPAKAARYSTAARSIDGMRQQMEAELWRWYPSFQDEYRYEDYYIGVRAIKPNASHARACEVVKIDNTIHVLSGKIDSIFYAEQEVLKCLCL